MQSIEATFDDISLDGGRDPRQALLKLIPAAAALAVVGLVGASVLHMRQAGVPDSLVPDSAIPDIVVPRLPPAPLPAAVPATNAVSNPYGDIIVDPSFLPELKTASQAGNSSPLASLEGVPPAPAGAIPAPENVPAPPKRDVPEIGDNAPLPPPRPPELGRPAAPDHNLPQPNVTIARPAAPPAPADNRSFFEKLFGLGQKSGAPVANTAPEGRGGKAPWLAFPLFGRSTPTSSYDRYTAIYDISGRTVYLPDGTRLEAHSGLGQALDDPRYVSERMRGPTPPNVYELTMREASFHGVQALRLTPVGDSTEFGRAGLLVHPFMLGPNGDSNGCVSVKDYEAFLRAYQSGQVKKLVVVARI